MASSGEVKIRAEIDPRLLELREVLESSWPQYAPEGLVAFAANGRLPASELAAIPGGRLRRDAARAWNDMRAYIGERHGVWIKPLGPRSSYRTYDDQVYFYNLYLNGGNPAAKPGTSNHGFGLAVDVATPVMAAYIRKYGAKFGWSDDEGKRVGEWWHFRYVGGYKGGVKARPKDKLAYLTTREKRLVLELADLRARATGQRKPKYPPGWVVNGDRYRLDRAREIKLWIRRQRQRIRDEARRTGWDKVNRRERYAVLIDAYNNKL